MITCSFSFNIKASEAKLGLGLVLTTTLMWALLSIASSDVSLFLQHETVLFEIDLTPFLKRKEELEEGECSSDELSQF
jgi:hypothetical protein